MDSSNVDTALEQLGHDWIDLRIEQYQVSHDHRLGLHRHERHPATQRQRGLDCNAINRDLEIGSWKAVPMYLAGNGPAPAHRCIDFLPIDALSATGTRSQQQCSNDDHSHDGPPLFDGKGRVRLAPTIR